MKTTTMTNDLRIQTTQTQASALRADLNMLLGNPHALGAWLPVVIKWTRSLMFTNSTASTIAKSSKMKTDFQFKPFFQNNNKQQSTQGQQS